MKDKCHICLLVYGKRGFSLAVVGSIVTMATLNSCDLLISKSRPATHKRAQPSFEQTSAAIERWR